MKDIIEEEVLPPTNPQDHHYILKTRQSSINLLQWAKDYQDDPAIKNFTFKLVDLIKDQMIYEHKTLWINYTTYDN
ncbi:hypothetical protein C0989_010024 [Termitomyces sp. Mn162]|nr:hypothetical protein C0989_010024 [Termitomyces sp. Mn162]